MPRYLSASILLLGLLLSAALNTGAALAKDLCQNTATQDSKAYERAVRQVMRLPELKRLQKAQPYPVAWMEIVDKETLIEGKCYWTVTIYLDRPDRMELWQGFYVRKSDQRILVDSPDGGDPVTLTEWRKHAH
jgi:hypothetical protein